MYKPKQLADRNDFRERKFGNCQYFQMMSFYEHQTEYNENSKRIIKLMRFTTIKKLFMY